MFLSCAFLFITYFQEHKDTNIFQNIRNSLEMFNKLKRVDDFVNPLLAIIS